MVVVKSCIDAMESFLNGVNLPVLMSLRVLLRLFY